MVTLLLLQGWDDLSADGLRFPATGVEVTAAGWIDRTGDITLQNDPLAS